MRDSYWEIPLARGNEMDLKVAVLWALVGWCGTPWPKPPWPLPLPDPPPEPRPNPWVIKLVGVVGGLVGGFAFNLMWSVEGSWTAIDVAASAVGAAAFAIGLSHLMIGTWPTPERPAPGPGPR